MRCPIDSDREPTHHASSPPSELRRDLSCKRAPERIPPPRSDDPDRGFLKDPTLDLPERKEQEGGIAYRAEELGVSGCIEGYRLDAVTTPPREIRAQLSPYLGGIELSTDLAESGSREISWGELSNSPALFHKLDESTPFKPFRAHRQESEEDAALEIIASFNFHRYQSVTQSPRIVLKPFAETLDKRGGGFYTREQSPHR
jgi:hypothetical protein